MGYDRLRMRKHIMAMMNQNRVHAPLSAVAESVLTSMVSEQQQAIEAQSQPVVPHQTEPPTITEPDTTSSSPSTSSTPSESIHKITPLKGAGDS
jgi:hypothetical protein